MKTQIAKQETKARSQTEKEHINIRCRPTTRHDRRRNANIFYQMRYHHGRFRHGKT